MPTVPYLTAAERETVVTSTDDDDTIRIWTCQPRFLSHLRRDGRFTEVGSGFYGTTGWGEFTIAADHWNPVTGARKRPMQLTDEQRAARAARLAAGKAARHNNVQAESSEPASSEEERAAAW